MKQPNKTGPLFTAICCARACTAGGMASLRFVWFAVEAALISAIVSVMNMARQKRLKRNPVHLLPYYPAVS
ncbi:hypothetical protein [Ponticaulis sp.]|uniref:hypothetical protein n=1 Tax=Ponticaulis sp. TaxID=2020902 RepID=UPI000C4EDE76|nr:hypothetical protein [Ponticaulis sp.]MBN04024.1 hypothetical protein [Ponticaulis sp.]